MVGDWIITDRDCLNSVLATLCRGVAVVDKENEFSTISSSASNSLAAISPTTGLLNAKDVGSAATLPTSGSVNLTVTTANGAATSGTTTNFSSGTVVPEKKRVLGRGSGKLFQKTRAASILSGQPVLGLSFNTSGSSSNSGSSNSVVRTSSKDGGVGLPTFATITSEVAIKSSAEVALNLLMNHLGNFPPHGVSTGVSHMSTLWSEDDEVRRILELKSRLKALQLQEKLDLEDWDGFDSVHSSQSFGNLAHGNASSASTAISGMVGLSSFPVAELRKFIRFYSYDNRVIFAMIEQPDWALNPNNPDEAATSMRRHPTMTLVLRDPAGKYSWMTTSKYTEDLGRTASTASNNSMKQSTLSVQQSQFLVPPSTTSPTSLSSSPSNPSNTNSPKLYLDIEGSPLIQHHQTRLNYGDGPDGGSSSPKSPSSGSPRRPSSAPSHMRGHIRSAVARSPFSGLSPERDNSLEQGRNKEFHVKPEPLPYKPKDASVLQKEIVNENSIPSIATLFEGESEPSKAFETLKGLLDSLKGKEKQFVEGIVR
jgi:hypothetical protein